MNTQLTYAPSPTASTSPAKPSANRIKRVAMMVLARLSLSPVSHLWKTDVYFISMTISQM